MKRLFLIGILFLMSLFVVIGTDDSCILCGIYGDVDDLVKFCGLGPNACNHADIIKWLETNKEKIEKSEIGSYEDLIKNEIVKESIITGLLIPPDKKISSVSKFKTLVNKIIFSDIKEGNSKELTGNLDRLLLAYINAEKFGGENKFSSSHYLNLGKEKGGAPYIKTETGFKIMLDQLKSDKIEKLNLGLGNKLNLKLVDKKNPLTMNIPANRQFEFGRTQRGEIIQFKDISEENSPAFVIETKVLDENDLDINFGEDGALAINDQDYFTKLNSKGLISVMDDGEKGFYVEALGGSDGEIPELKSSKFLPGGQFKTSMNLKLSYDENKEEFLVKGEPIKDADEYYFGKESEGIAFSKGFEYSNNNDIEVLKTKAVDGAHDSFLFGLDVSDGLAGRTTDEELEFISYPLYYDEKDKTVVRNFRGTISYKRDDNSKPIKIVGGNILTSQLILEKNAFDKDKFEAITVKNALVEAKTFQESVEISQDGFNGRLVLGYDGKVHAFDFKKDDQGKVNAELVLKKDGIEHRFSLKDLEHKGNAYGATFSVGKTTHPTLQDSGNLELDDDKKVTLVEGYWKSTNTDAQQKRVSSGTIIYRTGEDQYKILDKGNVVAMKKWAAGDSSGTAESTDAKPREVRGDDTAGADDIVGSAPELTEEELKARIKATDAKIKANLDRLLGKQKAEKAAPPPLGAPPKETVKAKQEQEKRELSSITTPKVVRLTIDDDGTKSIEQMAIDALVAQGVSENDAAFFVADNLIDPGTKTVKKCNSPEDSDCYSSLSAGLASHFTLQLTGDDYDKKLDKTSDKSSGYKVGRAITFFAGDYVRRLIGEEKDASQKAVELQLQSFDEQKEKIARVGGETVDNARKLDKQNTAVTTQDEYMQDKENYKPKTVVTRFLASVFGVRTVTTNGDELGSSTIDQPLPNNPDGSNDARVQATAVTKFLNAEGQAYEAYKAAAKDAAVQIASGNGDVEIDGSEITYNDLYKKYSPIVADYEKRFDTIRKLPNTQYAGVSVFSSMLPQVDQTKYEYEVSQDKTKSLSDDYKRLSLAFTKSYTNSKQASQFAAAVSQVDDPQEQAELYLKLLNMDGYNSNKIRQQAIEAAKAAGLDDYVRQFRQMSYNSGSGDLR